jgi:hypothetical protein
MANYKEADCLNDAAQLYVSLFLQVKGMIEGADDDTFETVMGNCDTLDLWYEATSGLLAKIDELDGDGYKIENADKIRHCHSEAALLLEELHDAKNAIEAVREDRSIGLQKFLDELRHPVHR